MIEGPRLGKASFDQLGYPSGLKKGTNTNIGGGRNTFLAYILWT